MSFAGLLLCEKQLLGLKYKIWLISLVLYLTDI